MLGINVFKDVKSASDYYINLSHESVYYLEHEVKATWFGKISKRIGYDGVQVKKSDFISFGKGQVPNSDISFKVRKVDNARSYYDFTFSAPKSVSLLFGLTKNVAIHECHIQAYKSVLTEIEANAQSQHNSATQRGWETCGELLIANFDHFLSRPCEIKKDGKTIYVSDPQMHTHCLIPNVTFSHINNRFQALELGNSVHRQAKYFEAAYHSHLAKNLEKLGFRTRITRDRFELVGITREQIMLYSNRSKTIDQFALENAILDKSKLALLTRNAKAKVVGEEEQYENWKSRLSEKEFEALFKLRDETINQIDSVSAEHAIEKSIQHHCERNSAFKQSDVLAYALKLGYGTLLPEDVKAALGRRSDVIKAEIDTVPFLTTKEMIRQESKLVMRANEGKGTFTPIFQNYTPKQHLLNDQQKNAIKQILNSRDFIIALKGSAGVGKTTLLTEARDAIALSGKQLFSLAPSSQAVSVLRSKGFEADTITGFLKNNSLQEKVFGQVILVDEAGMCGTKVTNQILAIAKEKKARLIMSGDTSQHAPPAQYGDAMRHLIEKAKVNTVTVNKIVRQQNEPYRSVVQSLAKNRTYEGFKKLDKLGGVIEEPDRDKRLDKIANAYLDTIKSKKSCIVISPTHKEVNLVNNIIRQNQKKEGLIKGKEREFNRLQTLSFTMEEKKEKANYEPGMVLRFISNSKGDYRAGVEFEVICGKKPNELKVRDRKHGMIKQLPLQHADRFEVYQQSKIHLAKGDQIRLTINTKTQQGSKALNGTSYHVTGFTKNGDIKLSNGKTLAKDIGHIRYSACDTSHSSQGKDADHVLISVDPSNGSFSREGLYVSVSRGKHSAKLFTSDKAELKKAIAKSEQRISAHEIAQQQQQQTLVRYQRNHHRSLNEKIREHDQTRRRTQWASPGISNQPKPKGHG
ncbi:MobF family relaxase [Roseivirga pacifica]|uniref:MobF family relaxase n=1 Tax=Roseivirga pacifica TaxID=1267423 RepID=UPI003BAEC223